MILRIRLLIENLAVQAAAFFRGRMGSGVAWSYVNTAAGIISNLVLIPLYLQYLGQENYGLWITISGVVSYLSLLNLGITQTTSNRFGTAVARREPSRARAVFATGFWAYVRIAGSALLLVWAIGPWLPWHLLVKGSEAAQAEVRWVLLLSASGFLTEQPFSLAGGCLRAIGRIGTQQKVGIGVNLGRLAAAIGYLSLGGGLQGLVVLLTLTNLLGHGALYWLLIREVHEVSLARRFRDMAVAAEMRGPSFYYFLLQASGAVAFSIDPIVISSLLATVLVAPYGVAQRLTMMAATAVGTIAINFGPAFLSAQARGEQQHLETLYRRSVIISAVLGVTAAVLLLLAGPLFITAWVGKSNFIGWPTFVALVMLMVINIVLQPADVLLMITARHKTYALFACWEAILSTILSISFAVKWGVLGVVAGTILGRIFGAAPVMVIQAHWLTRRAATWGVL
jgi:O-antigen/teichoic acid export membrane protein